MPDVAEMNKEQRISQILADVGEEKARGNLDTIYPPLRNPDPNIGRFKQLYPGSFERDQIWSGVAGRYPEFDVGAGKWSVSDSPQVQISEKSLSDLPDIIDLGHGLLCTKVAGGVISKMDPGGVVSHPARVVSGSGEAADYILLAVRRDIDPVNWSEVSLRLNYIEPLKKWVAISYQGRGLRADVPVNVHIINSGGYYFSDELIQELKSSNVRGVEFVNAASLKTVEKF